MIGYIGYEVIDIEPSDVSQAADWTLVQDGRVVVDCINGVEREYDKDNNLIRETRIS